MNIPLEEYLEKALKSEYKWLKENAEEIVHNLLNKKNNVTNAAT